MMTMLRSLTLFCIFAVSLFAAERPNIILILADDLGYSDLGCYGGEIRTPNLDALAEDGLRFTQFYNSSRCCPTRASLMTGLYPHQAGVGRMTFDEGLPGYQGRLRDDVVTIAEVLREAGYRTAMTGKWHLSPTKRTGRNALWVSHRLDLGPFSDPATYPVGRGFERHWGTIWGVVNYFDPFSLVRNTTPVESAGEGFYYTDAVNDQAAKFVREFSEGGDPFFLYVAHAAPHWPLHALPEDIERYEDVYQAGWDKIREARYRRMAGMGLLEPGKAPLPARHNKEARWSGNPHKQWDARAMAVHAAMVDRMDQGVRRILDSLDAAGERENTLILFLSDNGASPEEPSQFGPGFDRPSHTRDGRKIRYLTGKEAPPGPEDTYAGIGPVWANVSNTPFRYWKKEQYEGGTATPLIAHWPAGLKTEPGATAAETGHVMDIMATALELGEADYPGTRNGRKVPPPEGRSLAPVFRGEPLGPRTLFFEHFGARAVREGDWKLVAQAGEPWELYNLAEDRTETRDLADQEKEIAERLARKWQLWAERTHVLPAPD